MRRRRLPRILLNAATAVSLVLCVASVVLWIGSYRRTEGVIVRTSAVQRGGEWKVRLTQRTVLVSSGRVRFEYAEQKTGHGIQGSLPPSGEVTEWVHAAEPRDPGYTPAPASPAPDVVRYAGLGFELVLPAEPSAERDLADGSSDRPHVLTVPIAAVAAGTAVLPLCRVARRRRGDRAMRRMGAEENCPRCGYDLRATPDRCPECGRAAGPAA